MVDNPFSELDRSALTEIDLKEKQKGANGASSSAPSARKGSTKGDRWGFGTFFSNVLVSSCRVSLLSCSCSADPVHVCCSIWGEIQKPKSVDTRPPRRCSRWVTVHPRLAAVVVASRSLIVPTSCPTNPRPLPALPLLATTSLISYPKVFRTTLRRKRTSKNKEQV